MSKLYYYYSVLIECFLLFSKYSFFPKFMNYNYQLILSESFVLVTIVNSTNIQIMLTSVN